MNKWYGNRDIDRQLLESAYNSSHSNLFYGALTQGKRYNVYDEIRNGFCFGHGTRSMLTMRNFKIL